MPQGTSLFPGCFGGSTPRLVVEVRGVPEATPIDQGHPVARPPASQAVLTALPRGRRCPEPLRVPVPRAAPLTGAAQTWSHCAGCSRTLSQPGAWTGGYQPSHVLPLTLLRLDSPWGQAWLGDVSRFMSLTSLPGQGT